jgi:hypothetical protein
MSSKKISYGVITFLWLLLAVAFTQAQPTNLLLNPNVEERTSHWQTRGNAIAAQHPDGKWSFIVRFGGAFHQDVTLPEGASGKYALLIGRAASERINSDGAITGLPHLYGYMLEGADLRKSRIKTYLQGGAMLNRATKENEWATEWGIFPVPPEVGAIRFFLNQAERKDLPHNGSAAYFNELGLYLFATEEEAKAFVKAFNDKH